MATGDLKIDLINGAYSHMRISGITVQPSGEDNKLALTVMEELAATLRGLNVCLNYNFEESPDVNSKSGVSKEYRGPFKWVLAEHLLSEFGKGAADKIDQNLFKKSAGSLSALYSLTATPKQTQYSSRQAIGKGNEFRRGGIPRRFYEPVAEAPNDCDTNRMVVGDIDDFVEHFDSWVIGAETVASYVITADDGLTVASDSLTSPDISYRINAVGNNGTRSDAFLQVKIVATSSTGRITTRLIDFELVTIQEST